MDVQYHALQYLSQNLCDDTALDEILKRYLVHPRQKLSDLAQWRLGKRDIDWLGWLRHEFEARPLDARLARLLGRVGADSDGERLWISAQCAPESIRFVFLLAAARLKQVDAVAAVQEIALHDLDLARSRNAVAALLDAEEFVPAEELMRAASAAESFIRRGLLAHVRKHSVLDQIKILCRLEAAGYPPDRDEFGRLTRRLNRGRFNPTIADLEQLRRFSVDCPRMANWVRRLHLA